MLKVSKTIHFHNEIKHNFINALIFKFNIKTIIFEDSSNIRFIIDYV